MKEYVKDAARDVHVHIGSSIFSANVVTNIEKQF
jgi:hypothetical protein